MKSTPNVSEWLSWLGRVRFLAITFLVGIVIAARHLTPMPVPVRSFVQLIALWYTLALFYVILRRWMPLARCTRRCKLPAIYCWSRVSFTRPACRIATSSRSTSWRF
jgi:hypothetical protein